MAKPKGSPRKPTSNELPTPPKGTRVASTAVPQSAASRALAWAWRNRRKRSLQFGVGCGSLTFLCAVCLVVSFIGQALGLLPNAAQYTQTYAARTVTASVAQAATEDARRGTEAAAQQALTNIALSATATATITATLTSTATFTDVPTNTEAPTSAPALSLFATNTPQGASAVQVIATAPPTVTPTPTATPQPVMTSAPVVTMCTRSTANLRSCASTDNAQCPTVTQVNGGTSLQVVGEVTGVTVDGNTLWKIVVYNGQQLYIHSSLVQSSPPVAVSTPVQSQQLISTPVQSSGFTCSCSRTCTQITTCEEAYFQLNQCGCTARDDDDDTVPCESICPGG